MWTILWGELREVVWLASTDNRHRVADAKRDGSTARSPTANMRVFPRVISRRGYEVNYAPIRPI